MFIKTWEGGVGVVWHVSMLCTCWVSAAGVHACKDIAWLAGNGRVGYYYRFYSRLTVQFQRQF